MPSRLLTLLICVGWLVTTGYFVYHDLLPWLRPADAPSFKFDVVYQDHTLENKVAWSVSKNDKATHRTLIRIKYARDDETFEFQGNVNPIGNPTSENPSDWVKIQTVHRITRQGDLRSVRADI